MSETTGDRAYKVRLACGDGTRKAEALGAFVERIKRETGAKYDPATISLLERMKQQWRLSDVDAIAAVDPEKRGPKWLAYGGEQRETAPFRFDVELPEADVAPPPANQAVAGGAGLGASREGGAAKKPKRRRR